MCFYISSNKMALASLAVTAIEAELNARTFYLFSKLFRIMVKKNEKDMTWEWRIFKKTETSGTRKD